MKRRKNPQHTLSVSVRLWLYSDIYIWAPFSWIQKTLKFLFFHCACCYRTLFKNPTHALCFKIHIKTQLLFKTLECLRLLCHPTCFGHTLDHLQGMFLVQCCFPPCCFVTILLGYVAVFVSVLLSCIPLCCRSCCVLPQRMGWLRVLPVLPYT